MEFFFLRLLCVHPGRVAFSILISIKSSLSYFSKDELCTNSSQCCFGHFFVCFNGFVGTPKAPGHLEEAQSFPFPSQRYALSKSQLVHIISYILSEPISALSKSTLLSHHTSQHMQNQNVIPYNLNHLQYQYQPYYHRNQSHTETIAFRCLN